jgi:elongation factor Ts
MAQINAKDVMKLRNETGLPMMECKKALMESDGEIEAATEFLRKKLKGKMEKRLDRAAGEGRIATATNGASAVIVEIRCETDFTAKNENFVAASDKIAQIALKANTGDVDATDEIDAIIDELRITTGENCSFARGHKCEGAAGSTAFGSYVHHDGKTGVLIHAEGSVPDDTLRQLCMHITAAHPRPIGITTDDIPSEMVEKERKFRLDQAMESGKPKEIAEKMVEGGMRKFFSEIALLEQPFVMDEKKKIRDIVGDANVAAFFRWEVGEEV